MKLLFPIVVILLTVFFANAQEAKQQLKIGVAQFPPYSYKTPTGSIEGLEVTIVRECFKNSNFQVEFIDYPYGRLTIALKQKEIDGQIVTLKDDSFVDLHYSDIVAPEYQIVAISLTKKTFN